jgi:DNA polymerase III alpha subunit (gram-positive type)
MCNKMNNIVDINANCPHQVQELICAECKFRWISVRPFGLHLRNMECPKCLKFGYIIATGEILYDQEET